MEMDALCPEIGHFLLGEKGPRDKPFPLYCRGKPLRAALLASGGNRLLNIAPWGWNKNFYGSQSLSLARSSLFAPQKLECLLIETIEMGFRSTPVHKGISTLILLSFLGRPSEIDEYKWSLLVMPGVFFPIGALVILHETIDQLSSVVVLSWQ